MNIGERPLHFAAGRHWGTFFETDISRPIVIVLLIEQYQGNL